VVSVPLLWPCEKETKRKPMAGPNHLPIQGRGKPRKKKKGGKREERNIPHWFRGGQKGKGVLRERFALSRHVGGIRRRGRKKKEKNSKRKEKRKLPSS